jgi:hypothetical protein
VIAAAPREADEAQTRHREQGDRRRLGYRRGTDDGRSREDPGGSNVTWSRCSRPDVSTTRMPGSELKLVVVPVV